jgi:dUTPase
MYVSSKFSMYLVRLIDACFKDLEATVRGENGFGSTGGHGAL